MGKHGTQQKSLQHSNKIKCVSVNSDSQERVHVIQTP